MTYDEICDKIHELNQRMNDRKDFLNAIRRADYLPDADLSERFTRLVNEIKNRNEVDAERLVGLYVERDLMETMMEATA